jgi:hypothetical protein
VQNSHFIVLFYQFSQSIPVIISNNLHTVRLILPVDTETVEIFEEKWESINPFRSIFLTFSCKLFSVARRNRNVLILCYTEFCEYSFNNFAIRSIFGISSSKVRKLVDFFIYNPFGSGFSLILSTVKENCVC